MWYQAAQQLYTSSSPPEPGVADPDAHAHSPRRRHALGELSKNDAGAAPPKSLSHAPKRLPIDCNSIKSNSDWTAVPLMQGLFIEESKNEVPRRLATRLSTSDQSMPDYSHSITPRSSRDVSLHDTQHVQEEAAFPQESQFAELMAALSPAKASGTQAPPTTRVSSAANSPPAASKTSGGFEARVTSFQGQARAVSLTTREAPPPPSRGPSNTSTKSRLSNPQAAEKEKGPEKIRGVPATEVRGRKEGKGGDVDASTVVGGRKVGTVPIGQRQRSLTRVGEGHGAYASESKGDSKRKRASLSSITNLVSEHSEGSESSPSRKTSKKERKDGWVDPAGSPQSPESVIRVPLGSLHNVR
ncbi:MAG: hypothetical protein Q9219_000665 [cf. Caloplaca sp. 3 TL-2023]